MPVTITPTSTELSNTLSNTVNYCLDNALLEVSSATIKFCRIKYSIVYKGQTQTTETLTNVFNNFAQIKISEPIQSYIYLSEADINSFFANFKLDIPPAVVNFTIETLDGNYVILQTYTLTAKFHAGRSAGIPADGTTVERSLNYNSVLPLVYRYPTQNVEYKFKGNSLLFDKQAPSSALNIFQMLFFQKSHFADFSKNGGGFSSGFSSGFATADALANANPFYQYEEGYFNEIVSAYTIFGINFPIEVEAQNIIWLDENNIFRGMPLSGASTKEPEYIHYINPYSVDFHQRKAGSASTQNLKANTGWKLKSEVDLIDSLIRAERAWIFKDDISKRTEAYCNSKKFLKYDSSRQLFDYELEFEINE